MRRLGGRAWALSVAAHAALAALALTRLRPSAPAEIPRAAELELELGERQAPTLTGPARVGALAHAGAPREARAAHTRAPQETRAERALAPTGGGEEPSAPPDADAAPVASARAHPTLADLGVGKNPFLTGLGGLASGGRADGAARAADPEGVAEANARVQATLREDARAREAELGLGPDGPVRQALADATYAGESPVLARVVFEVHADGRGHVVSVEAISADQGLAPFRGVAARAKAALARRPPLRLPSSARGATLRVEVTSAWKLPSGHDPGATVELFGRRVSQGEGKASTRVVVLDPVPKVRCASPDDPKNDLKLPLCTVHVTVFGKDADPADLGAKPRRVVHTRVLASRIL